MAGTRVVIARYLYTLKVNPKIISQIINLIVVKPGYPSLLVITEFLEECGITCEIEPCVNRFQNKIVPDFFLAPIKDDDNALVLVLTVDLQNVVYMDGQNQITKEEYKTFFAKWSGEIIKFSISDIGAIEERVNVLRKSERDQRILIPTIRNIRSVSILAEAPIYLFCRKVSIYFSYLLIKLKVRPNWITFLWLICIVVAACLFAKGEYPWSVRAGSCFILLGYIFDNSDGEVARMTQTFSHIGGYLDTIAHALSGIILIFGATLGIYAVTGDHGVLKSGLVCILGGAIYNYLFGQLNYWRNQNRNYGIFHPVLIPLFWVFPIDLNLFLIGGMLNQLPIVLKIWEIASFTLASVLCGLFFLQEYANSNSNK